MFTSIREAARLVYEEADAFSMFDRGALAEAFSDDLGPLGIAELGVRWDAERASLDIALDAKDVAAVERALGEARAAEPGVLTALVGAVHRRAPRRPMMQSLTRSQLGSCSR